MKAHLNEILQLVWRRRPVTVVWHRHHGPAFVALFARALARPGSTFPSEAGGVSRRAALGAMADVLVANGSEPLHDLLEDVRPWLTGILAECRDLDDLCGRLASEAA
jgi:hypothetical protein